MSTQEQFLSRRKRSQLIALPQDFSDEEMAKDWTLSASDKKELSKYQKAYRLFIAIQLCCIRLYGRFLSEVYDLSPRIVNYLNSQLQLPPSITVKIPQRKATLLKQRKLLYGIPGVSKVLMKLPGINLAFGLNLWPRRDYSLLNYLTVEPSMDCIFLKVILSLLNEKCISKVLKWRPWFETI